MRNRPGAGKRGAASGTVTRVPDASTPSTSRSVCVATASRMCTNAYGSSPGAGKNHDSTARPSRTPSIRPAPCASQTSRRPRPNIPRCPALGGSTPSAPSRLSITSASTPSPSSVHRSSCFQLRSAGECKLRVRAFHDSRNERLGAPNDSTIRPDPRPALAMAASAFVTSSGMICTKSTPPWAKFSRK